MSSRILAIDTATEACSVALQVEDQIQSHFEICPQQHSQRILPMVDDILSKAGAQLAEMNGLAFGRGPGSFTGVRIGIGIAQGLGFGVGIPLIPISNLQIIAQGAARRFPQHSRIAVAIDARMNEVYFAEYTLVNGLVEAVTEESVLSPQALVEHLQNRADTLLAVGTGWQAYHEVFSPLFTGNLLVSAPSEDESVHLPNAVDMLPLAQQMFAAGLAVSATEAEPVYVRDTVTWKKLPGRE